MIRTAAVEACVGLGFVALAMLGGPWFVASALAWGVAVAARAVGPRVGARPALLMLVVGASVLASGGAGGVLSLESAVVAGLVLLQLQRRLARRGPLDDRVAVVVAGLMLVVTAGRTTDAVFLALALSWTLALPLALLPAGRESAPSGLHLLVGGLVHVAGSFCVFVLLPRTGSAEPVPDEAVKLVGFAPDVELGTLDALLDDPAVVFRAQVDGELAEPVYWRGLALDGFDGHRWYSSTPPVPGRTQPAVDGVRVAITPSGPSDGVLFAPGVVQHVEADQVRADAQGAWYVPAAASSRPYVVQVEPRGAGEPWLSEPSLRTARWLDLPAMDAGVSELAARVAGDGPAAEQAGRLVDWLAGEVVYTRSAGDHGRRPIQSFLLERREGHCEYVAAGLVVLLRSRGIPARVVNGFLGGEVDPLTGERVVRRQHAHSWTEALLDGRWVLLDATPQATTPVPAAAPRRQLLDAAEAWWQREVVAYDREAQRASLQEATSVVHGWLERPLRAAGTVLLGLGSLAAVVWVARGVWRRRLPGAERRAPEGLSGPLQRAERALADAGWVPPSAAPPVEVARWLRGRAPDPAVDAFEALAWLHYDVVFGGVPASQVRGRARVLAERVAGALDAEAPSPR